MYINSEMDTEETQTESRPTIAQIVAAEIARQERERNLNDAIANADSPNMATRIAGRIQLET